MAVMDLVQGRDAYHEFKHRDLPPTMLEVIQLALTKTPHDAALVFGDVPRPNIMVVKTGNQHGNGEWHADCSTSIGLGRSAMGGIHH
jgi:hypothetical protein